MAGKRKIDAACGPMAEMPAASATPVTGVAPVEAKPKNKVTPERHAALRTYQVKSQQRKRPSLRISKVEKQSRRKRYRVSPKSS